MDVCSLGVIRNGMGTPLRKSNKFIGIFDFFDRKNLYIFVIKSPTIFCIIRNYKKRKENKKTKIILVVNIVLITNKYTEE